MLLPEAFCVHFGHSTDSEVITPTESKSEQSVYNRKSFKIARFQLSTFNLRQRRLRWLSQDDAHKNDVLFYMSEAELLRMLYPYLFLSVRFDNTRGIAVASLSISIYMLYFRTHGTDNEKGNKGRKNESKKKKKKN